jgi:hypothetical protein
MKSCCFWSQYNIWGTTGTQHVCYAISSHWALALNAAIAYKPCHAMPFTKLNSSRYAKQSVTAGDEAGVRTRATSDSPQTVCTPLSFHPPLLVSTSKYNNVRTRERYTVVSYVLCRRGTFLTRHAAPLVRCVFPRCISHRARTHIHTMHRTSHARRR